MVSVTFRKINAEKGYEMRVWWKDLLAFSIRLTKGEIGGIEKEAARVLR